MPTRFAAALVVALGLLRQAGNADEPSGGNYLVFPITTDLQHTLLGAGEEAKACVLINGSSIVKNSMIDASALDLQALAKELAPYADRDKGIVFFNIRFGQKSVGFDRQASSMLMLALEAFGRRAGFHTVNVSQSAYIDWEKSIAAVNEKTNGQTDEDESAVGNELVRVYPVRTPLTRYLLGNNDCVVDVLAPISEEGGEALSAEIRKAILRYVPKAGVTHQDTINFRVRSGNGSEKAIDQFKRQDSVGLTKVLGYKQQTITYLNP